MHDDDADATLAGFADSRGFAAEIVATTGALIVVLDRAGRIVAFNPACEQLTGYRCAEVRGQPF